MALVATEPERPEEGDWWEEIQRRKRAEAGARAGAARGGRGGPMGVALGAGIGAAQAVGLEEVTTERDTLTARYEQRDEEMRRRAIDERPLSVGEHAGDFGKSAVKGLAKQVTTTVTQLGGLAETRARQLAWLSGLSQEDLTTPTYDDEGNVTGRRLITAADSEPARLGEEAAKWLDAHLPTHGRFSSDVGQAIGSSAFFLMGGAVGAAAKAPAWLTTASLGFTANGLGTYYDILYSGGSEEDAMAGGLVAAGVGILEAATLAPVLSRLNGPDDAIMKVLRKALVGPGRIGTGLKEGAGEFLQESFEQVVDNVLLDRLTPRDVDALEGVVRGGGAGGVSGLLLGILTGGAAKGVRARKVAAEALTEALGDDATEAEVQAALNQLHGVAPIAPVGTGSPAADAALQDAIDAEAPLPSEVTPPTAAAAAEAPAVPAAAPVQAPAPAVLTPEQEQRVGELEEKIQAGEATDAEKAEFRELAYEPEVTPVDEAPGRGPTAPKPGSQAIRSVDQVQAHTRGLLEKYGAPSVIAPADKDMQFTESVLRARGVDVVFVDGLKGKKGTTAWGFYDWTAKTVVINRQAGRKKMAIVTGIHELTHHMQKWFGGDYKVAAAKWAELDPVGWRKALATAQETYEGDTNQTAEEYAELLHEEQGAIWAQAQIEYLIPLLQNDKRMLKLATKDRTTFEKLVDAIINTARKLGIKATDPELRRLQRLVKELGLEGAATAHQKAAEAALVAKNLFNKALTIHEALEVDTTPAGTPLSPKAGPASTPSSLAVPRDVAAKGTGEPARAGTYAPSDADIRFDISPEAESKKAPPYFSALERAVEQQAQKRYNTQQLSSFLKKQPGITEEELKYVGFEDMLKGRKSVTKEEVLEFLRANRVEVREVVLGEPESLPEPLGELPEGYDVIVDDKQPMNRRFGVTPPGQVHARPWAGRHLTAEAAEAAALAQLNYQRERAERTAPRHESYQLPGGEAYRELLLTLPREKKAAKWAGGDRFQVSFQGDVIGWWPIKDMETGRVVERLATNREAVTRAHAYNAQRAEYRQEAERAEDAAGIFTGGHFDEPNVLAHIRFNERTDSEGKRTLFIEEIQSDWHQAGRKKGYAEGPMQATRAERKTGYWEVTADSGQFVTNVYESTAETAELAIAEANRRLRENPMSTASRSLVPDAPWKRDWHVLALKRAIKWAADNGFDQVAWTTGWQQVERYETEYRRAVDQITWSQLSEGYVQVIAKKDGRQAYEKQFDERGVTSRGDGKTVEEIFGKEIAKRILSEESGTIEQEGLTIGGKGMEGFYDKMLVSAANKLGKRFGVKVGQAQIVEQDYKVELYDGQYRVRYGGVLISTHETAEAAWDEAERQGGVGRPTTVHALPLTDDMRATVSGQGFSTFAPQFSLVPGTPVPGYQGQPAVVDAFDKPSEGAVGTTIRVMADTMEPLRRWEEAIKKQGATLTDASSAYLQDTLWKGRAQQRITERVMRRFRDPIVEAMKRAKLTAEQVGEFLIARHAGERNAQVRKLYAVGEGPEHPAGMTTADAAAVLAQYAGDAEMQRIGRIWDRMNKSKLREMVAAGLIEQEEMDAFTSTYKHWAPLRTMSKDESAWTGMGRGHDIRNAEFKRAMGRETMADNPLDFGFASYAMSIVRAEKAVVGRAFLAAIEANPDPGFATIGEVKFKRVIDKKSGMVRRVYDLASENDPEVLIVKRDGKKIRIRINERYVILAQALKNQNTVHGGKITESVAKATRLYSGALTRDNPFFMLFNGWRDFGNAKKVAKGEMGVQVKLRDMFKVYAALNQASDPKATGTLVERARLYRRAGAPITFLDLGGLSQQTKELGNLFTKKGMVKGTAKKWLDASRRWNDIVENGARFMAFNDMVERGHSVDRAAFYAKELGTNFERHGDIGPAMNAYFMFANAGVGSLRRFGQAVKHPDVRRSIYAVIAWAVMRDMANRLIAGIDPEDEENYYDKLLREKPYIADSNLIMFYGRGEGDYIMLPQPFIFRWFSALGTKASAVANGAIKPGQATGELMSGLLEEVSPLGGAEHPAQTLSPWFLDPLTDTWVNKNWAGSPIYPTKFDPSQPDSELYFPGAPKWAIAAARHMNRLTGGTSAEPGFVSVSPESLDHFSHFLTPGVFSELRRLGAATAELDVNVEDVPIVRRVIGRANPYYAQARARDAFKQIQSAPKRNEALKAEGREPSADAIFASPSWLARMKRVKKQYGVLDDKYRAAKGKEKDELLERIDKLLKPFNRDARKALE